MLMDMSLLERHRLFRCDSPQRSHDAVAEAFCDHGLQWGSGRVDTALSRLPFEHTELYLLQYGAEVEVRPRAFVDFVLVHVSLSGVLSLEGERDRLDCRTGGAVLLGRQPALKMRWAEGTRQLILKIPRHRLPDDLAIPPALTFDAIRTQQLKSLLQALLYASQTRHAGPGQDDWVASLEQSLISFILQALLPPTASAGAGPLPAPTRDQARIEKLMGYLQGRLGAPIALEDMARVTGLSPRGLHLLCQRELGRTPTTILRDLRLDAVRERLQASPDTAITELALTHGFGHLGRFSAYYRERFGELPTQTQRGRCG